MKFVIVAVLFGLLGCGKDVQFIAGPQGVPGTNGTDAFSWVPVQLCSQCTTHYPDTFAEVTFCFQNNLYGTYSKNGGFSAQLPQGSYNSHGVNCSCTVTIGPNCSVSN